MPHLLGLFEFAEHASTTSRTLMLHIPRHQLVVFTGISGSGSLRWLLQACNGGGASAAYLDSVAPYVRGDCFISWVFHNLMKSRECPLAVALEQQRGSPTTPSSVGSVTTLSNLLRMLYSRAGDYP